MGFRVTGGQSLFAQVIVAGEERSRQSVASSGALSPARESELAVVERLPGWVERVVLEIYRQMMGGQGIPQEDRDHLGSEPPVS